MSLLEGAGYGTFVTVATYKANEHVTLMKTDLLPIKDLKKTSYRSYCVLLDTKFYLDAAEMINDDNHGAQINDCFDKAGYNTYGEGLKMDDGTWVPLYQIIAARDLKLGEELYLEYGKLLWCYRGNFKNLTPNQQLKCRAHYNISDEDFVDELMEQKAKQPPAKKGKKSKVVVEEVKVASPSRKRKVKG